MGVFLRKIFTTKYLTQKSVHLRLYEKEMCLPYNNFKKRTVTTLHKFQTQNECSVMCRKYCTSLDQNNTKNITQTKSETAHMYWLLENSVHYENLLSFPITVKMHISDERAEELINTDWSSSDEQSIFVALKHITYNHMNTGKVFSAEEYDKILKALIPMLPRYTDTELKNILKYLRPFHIKIKKCQHYLEFMKVMSRECYRRFSSSVDNILSVCDMLYNLKAQESEFFWRGMRKLGDRVTKLTSKQFVLFLFLLSTYKNRQINMYDVEYRLQECMHDISVDELGIISLAFFKNMKRISNPTIVSHMIKKLIDGANTVDSISLASSMKVLRLWSVNFNDFRICCQNDSKQLFPIYVTPSSAFVYKMLSKNFCYSTKLQEISTFRLLLNALLPNTERLSTMCLTHISHACANILVYEEQLMNKIMERLNDEIKSVRIKDIERIIFAMSTLCPPNVDFNAKYQHVLEELETSFDTTRAEEIKFYPHSIVHILTYMSHRDVYSQKLLTKVFDHKYLNNLKSRQQGALPYNLWVLDCNIDIDIPAYDGPRLSDKNIESIRKRSNYMKTQDIENNATLKFMSELVFTCKESLGANVYIDYILPCDPMMNIIIGLDESNNLVPAENLLSTIPKSALRRVDTENLKHINWKVIVPIIDMTIVKGTGQFNGITLKRIRQLGRIGYTPVIIYCHEWNVIPTQEKDNYIRRLILNETDANGLALEELA